AAVDQRHLRAKSGENAGKFHRDITTTPNEYSSWLLRQMEGFIRCDDVFDAGNGRPALRGSAGRNENVFRPDRGAAGKQPYRMRILNNGSAFYDRDTRLFQIRDINCLETRNLLVLVCDQRGPVEDWRRQAPAKPGSIFKFMRKA